MKPLHPILYAAIALALAALPASAQTPAPKADSAQKTFATPEEAAKALVDAVKAKSVDGLLAIVGPGSASWLFSGDKVADANDWKVFVAAYDEKNELDKQSDSKVILDVGKDDWPFPAPIVKRGSRWAFDTNAGREEIVNRRIGRNELDTIQTLLAICDAEREYAETDANSSGFPDYARRFLSTPGKKDGLYWEAKPGEPRSPLGPMVAMAAHEGYGKQAKEAAGSNEPRAFHGYQFRILTAQGKDAPGGAYDYLVGNRLMGGFAVVAYPARYGSSGIMTFLVNHEGVVYEKDLGPKTPAIGASMSVFNPDASWRKTQ